MEQGGKLVGGVIKVKPINDAVRLYADAESRNPAEETMR